MESEGSRRQNAGPTNRKRIEADAWDKRANKLKVQYLYGTCGRRCDGHKRERDTHYPGRSALNNRQKSAEGIVSLVFFKKKLE